MGLDTVELVMAFEDEFGIVITDGEAEKMETPGLVADYVMERVRTRKDYPCASQAAFYRLRTVLMREFGIPRHDIRPGMPLQRVLGHDVRGNWKKLGKVLGSHPLPPLARSRFLVYGGVTAIPLAMAAGFWTAGASVGMAAFAGCVLMIAAERLSKPWASVLPAGMTTLDALVPYAGGAGTAIWTRAEVLARVMAITVEHLGLPPGKVHEHAHFVSELGAD